MAGIIPIGAIPVMRSQERSTEAVSQRLSNHRRSLRQVNRHGDQEIPPDDEYGEIEKYKRHLLRGSSCNEKMESDASKPDEIEYRSFTEPDPLTNIILNVENTELYVHREVLAQWSPVLLTMFSSSFKESELNCTIKLPGKTLKEMNLFLNCIYPPQHKITDEDVEILLPLIREYDVPLLRQQCEEVLLKQEASLELVLIAAEFDMQRLLEKMVEKCSSLPLPSIDHTKNEAALEIPHELMFDIYRLKIIKAVGVAKSLQKELCNVKLKHQALLSFGTQKNSYPCDKHRTINEECVSCLQSFRQMVFSISNDSTR